MTHTRLASTRSGLRTRPPGATCFVTLALDPPGATALIDEVSLLRDVYASVMAEHPVGCVAMVVLPDHLHAVWTLPAGDTDIQLRLRKLRAVFARHAEAPVSWQTQAPPRLILGAHEERQYRDFCWMDPVRHGLVPAPTDWRWSSLTGEVRAGTVPPDWSGQLEDPRIDGGGRPSQVSQAATTISPLPGVLIN